MQMSSRQKKRVEHQMVHYCAVGYPNVTNKSISVLFTESSQKLPFKRKKSIDSNHEDLLISQNSTQSSKSGISVTHCHDEDSSEDSSQDARKKKKARTTFTGRQIFELEKQFEVKKYLSSSERSDMAKLLNVTETQVN